jgi:CRISPR/Cas system-associated endonuclease Cas3-HD
MDADLLRHKWKNRLGGRFDVRLLSSSLDAETKKPAMRGLGLLSIGTSLPENYQKSLCCKTPLTNFAIIYFSSIG